MNRRSFLVGSLVLAGLPGLSLASAKTDRRFVLILIRGGLDGLAAVPPVGDPGLSALRDPIEGATKLDATFSLHPGLAGLQPRWDAGELAVVHATAPPYDRHSHFDAQNVLENGTTVPMSEKTGWLNRALGARGDTAAGLALGSSLPLVLRGTAPASSIDPRHLPRVNPVYFDAVRAMYGDDPPFATALDRGLATAAMFERTGKLDHEQTTASLGAVMALDDGPRIAVLELGGFDTHTAEARSLEQGLPELAASIDGLRTGLGDAWAKTVVLAVTEFGRAARTNGTDGTDHGVGGAALLVGGAVAGKRVLGDWPGLGEKDLLEGRDLRPTTDLRRVFKGVLHDHLGVASAALSTTVFPGSGNVAPLEGLIRS